VRRRATLGGGHDHVLAIWEVDQRTDPLGARPSSDVMDQDHRSAFEVPTDATGVATELVDDPRVPAAWSLGLSHVRFPSSIVASVDRQQRWTACDSRGPTGTPGGELRRTAWLIWGREVPQFGSFAVVVPAR
jgi:hypothetical protein